MVGEAHHTKSPDATSPASLASLSRSASVISTSSSDEAASILTPLQRPLRQFSSPRSSSPATSISPKTRAPSYLSRELGIPTDPLLAPATSKARSKSRGRNISIDDFVMGETLGEGAYSTVLHATYTPIGKQYAVKVMDKPFLARRKKTNVPLVERTALVRLGDGHPGVVKLYYTLQDEMSLYFVIDLATNGEMQSLITRYGSLSTTCARYYAAQIIDAVGFIHSKGVIHRDLKPENLLLDDAYRIRITDFGTAKILESDISAENFVGTAQYVAPELIQSNETTKSSDLWAFGCILYQMIAGRFAFHGMSDYLIMQKVKQIDYSFPDGFPEDAKDLIQKLLVEDPTKRLGAGEADSDNSILALKAHTFFAQIQWDTIWTGPVPQLEVGMLKKEPVVAGQSAWQDIGAEWDALVQHDDGIEWSEPPSSGNLSDNRALSVPSIGPLGEIRPMQSSTPAYTFPPNQPAIAPQEESPESSESDEKLANGMQAMAPFRNSSPDGERRTELLALDHERGRNQAMTPVQGNGPPIDRSSLLGLDSEETIGFYSLIEIRTLRRRGSKLLTLPVSPLKHKRRELVLTNRRLLCIKHSTKVHGQTSVKVELFLAPLKTKKDDGRSSVSTVEVKGEREFTVLTSSRNHTFTCSDSSLAATWVQKIDEALSSTRRTNLPSTDAKGV